MGKSFKWDGQKPVETETSDNQEPVLVWDGTKVVEKKKEEVFGKQSKPSASAAPSTSSGLVELGGGIPATEADAKRIAEAQRIERRKQIGVPLPEGGVIGFSDDKDPVSNYSKNLLTKTKVSLAPQPSTTTTPAKPVIPLAAKKEEQKAAETVRAEEKNVLESKELTPAQAYDEIKNAENYFRYNQNESAVQLAKSLGLTNPNDVYTMPEKELEKAVRSGNRTDQLALKAVKDARAARKAFSENSDILDAAIDFEASQNPEIKKQLEFLTDAEISTPQSIEDIIAGKSPEKTRYANKLVYGDATIGTIVFQALNNPIFAQEAKRNPAFATQYKEKLSNLVNENKEFGKVYVANKIAQKMEDEGVNNPLLNIVTKSEADDIVAKLVESGEMNAIERRFYENNIRPRLGLENLGRAIVNSPAIETTGFIESTLKSATQTGLDIGKGLAEITNVRNMVSGDKKALSEDIEGAYRRTYVKPKGVISEMAQGGGNLLGQVLATAGPAKLLQSLKIANNINTGIGLTGAMQSYGQYMPEARMTFPGERVKQKDYTLLMAGINYFTEQIFKDTKVLDGIMNKMKPSVVSTIKDFTEKKISSEAARNAISNAFKKAVKDVPEALPLIAKSIGENTFEEVSAEWLGQLNKGVFEGKSLSDSINDKQIAEVARTTLLSTPFVAAVSARADLKNRRGIAAVQLYDMGLNAAEWKAKINELSKIDPEIAKDADDKIKNLTILENIVNDLEATDYSYEKKAKIALAELDNTIRKERTENLSSEILKKAEKEKIKTNEEEAVNILNEKDELPELNQELSKEELKAAKILGKYELPGMYAEIMEEDPIGVLRDIAQQALGISVEGEQLKGGGRKQEMIEQGYPAELIEEAISFFPKPKVRVTAEQMEAAQDKDGKDEFIIGEDGSPLIVYHSTLLDFDEFKEGVTYFAEDEAYSKYIAKLMNKQGRSYKEIKDEEVRTIPVKLKTNRVYELPKGKEMNGNVIKSLIENDPKFTEKYDAVKGVDLYSDNKIVYAVFDKNKIVLESKPKTEKDAVQIETTDEVDVRQQTGNGEGVGERNAQPEIIAEESESTGEKQEEVGPPPISEPPRKPSIHAERPNVEISFKGLQDVANEFSFEDVQSRDRKSDVQLRTDARSTMQDWAEKGEYGKKVTSLVETAEKGQPLSDEQRVILEQHLANVIGESREIDKMSPEYDVKLREIKRLKDAGQASRSAAGAALRVPLGGSRPMAAIEDYFLQEMEDTGTNVLTSEQKEQLLKEFDEITKAEKEYQNKIAALEEEVARLKAENNVKTEKKKTGQSRKTRDDFSKERKDIVANIREKLKKSRGQLQATPIPYAQELITIAPDVAKLVKSYVEQGIFELSDIVKRIHGDLKEDIPGIRERDVRDIIAGEYNEKKPTRNQLAELLYNIRTEAKLLAELERLEAGGEPKSPRDKIKSNKRIAELRDKIRSFKKDEQVSIAKLKALKSKYQKQITTLEEKIRKGDFGPDAKSKPLELDKEALELKDKLIKLKNEREYRRMKNLLDNQTKWEKAMRYTAEVLNVPRSLMASMDFSGLLRQAIVPAVARPSMSTKAANQMFKSAFSQKEYDRWLFDLEQSPRFELMKEAKLGLTDQKSPSLQAREEAFMSSLAEKIPIAGSLVKGSNRAYSQVLNKMRVDLFNRFADAMEQRGVTWKNNPEAYKQMAKFVNNATGRGDLPTSLETAAPFLNSLFFSPRLIASRLNMLTYWAQPRLYTKVPKEVRKAYFKDMATFIGIGITVLAMFKAMGADVEDDPRSSDFGKIKYGNTRWDIWGGFQPYARVATQILTGQRKSTRTGRIQKLDGEGPFGDDRMDVLGSFGRGKLAPVPSMVLDITSGRNIIGEDIDVTEWSSKTNRKGDRTIGLKEYAATHLLPLNFTGLEEALQDQGVRAWFTVGIPTTFGVGSQTYENK